MLLNGGGDRRWVERLAAVEVCDQRRCRRGASSERRWGSATSGGTNEGRAATGGGGERLWGGAGRGASIGGSATSIDGGGS